MERADSDAHTTEESLNTRTHFPGGLIGKRQRQNLIGLNTSLQQSHNTVRDDASFPGPRACQNQQRSLIMLDRLMLRIGKTRGDCGYVNGQDETPRSCGKPSADGQMAIFLIELLHSRRRDLDSQLDEEQMHIAKKLNDFVRHGYQKVCRASQQDSMTRKKKLRKESSWQNYAPESVQNAEDRLLYL